MTVSSSTNKIIGNGNGVTTSWPFSFKVFDPGHLVVTYTDASGDEAALDPGQYVVSLNADQDASPGGTVSYSPAIASGSKLTVLRSVPYTQAIDIKNQGGFFPEVLERGFDLVVMQVQQLREQLARSLKLSPSQSVIGELEATDADRANTFLGFSSTGELALYAGVASSSVSVALQPVVNAASLAAARTAMAVPGLGANIFTGSQTLPGNAASPLEAVPKQQAESIAAASATVRVQTFGSSGTYTPHAKMVSAIIECVGGGGGGGGTATGGANVGAGGGGGGAGSYSRKVVTAADVGASKAVTIGAAGSAGSSGNNAGGNGGDTSVGLLCIAKGGIGGSGCDGSVPAPGGAGGVAGTGDLTSAGNPGGRSEAVSGGQGRGISGYGANSYLGGGAPGTNTATTQAGTAAVGAGGGGSGGSTFNGGGAAAGGAGAAGYVVITEFCAA